MNETLNRNQETASQSTGWESLRGVAFNSGEATAAPQISDSEAVAAIYRNMNVARKEAVANADDAQARKLEYDMEILNDAYNYIQEPDHQGKTMEQAFGEIKANYLNQLDSAPDGPAKDDIFNKFQSASDLHQTYESLKSYIASEQAGK